jgi:hypothetical protein
LHQANEIHDEIQQGQDSETVLIAFYVNNFALNIDHFIDTLELINTLYFHGIHNAI